MKFVGGKSGTLLLSVSLAVLMASAISRTSQATTGFPGMLVEVNSEEGQARLARAGVRADFESLVYNFEVQASKELGGPASATIVLNALRAQAADRAIKAAQKDPKHKAVAKLPLGIDPHYHRYTQQTFFTPETDKVKTYPEVMGATHTAHVGKQADSGYQLKQYARVLRAHGLKVNLRVANDSLTDKQIKEELIANLGRRGDYIIVNYNRIALGQRGAEHYSPLGAYDKTSDSFLVMDVNPSVAPWVWVRTPDLIFALRNHSGSEHRGYVLVADDVAPAEFQTASR